MALEIITAVDPHTMSIELERQLLGDSHAEYQARLQLYRSGQAYVAR